jgi:hypothetical protein
VQYFHSFDLSSFDMVRVFTAHILCDPDKFLRDKIAGNSSEWRAIAGECAPLNISNPDPHCEKNGRGKKNIQVR